MALRYYLFLFVGAGVSSNVYLVDDEYADDEESISVGIFGNVRSEILPKKISPFVDVRLGGMVGDLEGFYFAPTVGVRFNHFNLGIGYELVKNNEEYDYYDYYYSYSETTSVFSVKFTWDWGARR